MKETKIRWAGSSWNPMTGCTKVSPGCDHCYAETLALRLGPPAFPNYFEPTFKPYRLGQPRGWSPRRIFVNSMSDVHHAAFPDAEIDQVYDAMAAVPKHDYLVLTKRPGRMLRYLVGSRIGAGWLERRGLAEVPAHIWLGTSIESDKFTTRATVLRQIPVPIRFLSLEPLLGPLPSLDLAGISWVIVGGESGAGYRPMDHAWARELRDRCQIARGGRQVAFYFKQSSAYRSEQGQLLDGERWEQYPMPHPALPARVVEGVPIGVYTDAGHDDHPGQEVLV